MRQRQQNAGSFPDPGRIFFPAQSDLDAYMAMISDILSEITADGLFSLFIPSLFSGR